MAAYVFIMADARFHLPLVPLLAVFSATAWTAPGLARRSLDGLRRGEVRWALAWLAAATLLIAWAWDLGHDWPRLLAVMQPDGYLLHLNY
jgi:hypothetical protein